jgi:uncharacterized protein YecT (DUF1311 family)
VGKGTGVVIAVTVAVFVIRAGPVRAQGIEEPTPCTDTVRLGDTNRCWAQEAERADVEMRQVYLTALEKLSRRAAENLKKAQKLWLEFRDAHTATVLGDENALANGLEYSLCLSILRWRLARERTAELKRLLQPDDESMCPL